MLPYMLNKTVSFSINKRIIILIYLYFFGDRFYPWICIKLQIECSQTYTVDGVVIAVHWLGVLYLIEIYW